MSLMALSSGNVVSQEDAVIDGMRWQNNGSNVAREWCRSPRPARRSFGERVGVQTGPSSAHSRPLRGGHGGVVIPCVAGGPWTGDSVLLILLKPNMTTLELLSPSTGVIGRITRLYSDGVRNRCFHFAYLEHRHFRERQA